MKLRTRRPTRAFWAALAVAIGAAAVALGAAEQFGRGIGLMVGGAALVTYALLIVDVD